MTADTIHYDQAVWMQPIRDKHGKQYYLLGKVQNAELPHTLAVSEVGGSGATLMFCQLHDVAYRLGETCEGCRMSPVEAPVE